MIVKKILKLISIIIFIVIICVLVVILKNNVNHNYTIYFEKSLINEYLKEYKTNADSIEITRIVDNTIYGIFNDTTHHPNCNKY